MDFLRMFLIMARAVPIAPTTVSGNHILLDLGSDALTPDLSPSVSEKAPRSVGSRDGVLGD